MRYKTLALILPVMMALQSSSFADSTSRENPGTVLLFPYYDDTPGNMTLVTITNTGALNVYVHLVWVDGETCSPANSWVQLTSHDTLTFLNSALNPAGGRGFLYAHAVSAGADSEVDYDFLIGSETVIGTLGGTVMSAFSLNAAIFQALDLTPDGELNLDGAEYGAAPKEIFFPRFFGQPDAGTTGFFESRVILINLTGGKYFRNTSSVLIMNDEGVAFSDVREFDCHELLLLGDFIPATRNAFLLATAHDPEEPVGFPGLIETGWIRIRPEQATDNHSLITRASAYAVLIERMGIWTVHADLPLQVEGEVNDYERVALWPTVH